jgi:toxin YhaV
MPSHRQRPGRPSPDASPIVVVKGWSLYAHPVFIDQFQTLLEEVEELRKANPDGYRDKKKTKLLAAIFKMALEVIPQDPANRVFWLGNTLGAEYRHWHRGKFFEGRYRLFFRYSLAEKIIVLAWVNDEETLRTYGSKSDAYAVFKKMLDKKRPPDGWESLLHEAKGAIPRAKKILERGKDAK